MEISEEIKQLKELLEGAKVLEVRETDAHESLCDLFVEKKGKKYSFTIGATDLGWWTSNLRSPNGDFKNFQDLIERSFEHYNYHGEYGKDYYEAFDSPTERLIGFRCKKCSKEFTASITTVKSSEYADLLGDPESRKKFAKLLSEGYIQNKKIALEYLEVLEKEKNSKRKK